MVRCAMGMTVVVLLTGATGGVRAGQADGDDETEWSYARPSILGQAGPRLGRYSFRAVMEAAFPKLRAPDKRVEQGDPVIGQLLALRGRFLITDDEQVRPGPHAVALLAVWEEEAEQFVIWRPELIVVGLVAGRLKVLGHYLMEDYEHEFVPARDAGSGYKLEAWPLHPSASGIGVRLDRSAAGPDGHVANAQQSILFVGPPEEGDEDGELLEVFARDLLESSMEHPPGEPAFGEVARTRIGIDRQLMVNGLRVLETEFHTSTTEGGRVRRVEIEYEWYCWSSGSYDPCEEEQLNPTAALKQAR